MLECRHCGQFFREAEERLGARCPRCREPLYERTFLQQQKREGTRSDGSKCSLHANNPAVGTCQRCGNFLCGLCRTRWYDKALCLACLERIVETKETRPEDMRDHRRQALLALIFGLSAWLLLLFAGLSLFGLRSDQPNEGVLLLAGLIGLASFVPALFGVGQGAAAIRARGDRMILATSGLLLSGVHLGAALGVFLICLWAQ